jgi:hypothetical protein
MFKILSFYESAVHVYRPPRDDWQGKTDVTRRKPGPVVQELCRDCPGTECGSPL